jgi:hypothetical protein
MKPATCRLTSTSHEENEMPTGTKLIVRRGY